MLAFIRRVKRWEVAQQGPTCVSVFHLADAFASRRFDWRIFLFSTHRGSGFFALAPHTVVFNRRVKPSHVWPRSSPRWLTRSRSPRVRGPAEPRLSPPLLHQLRRSRPPPSRLIRVVRPTLVRDRIPLRRAVFFAPALPLWWESHLGWRS